MDKNAASDEELVAGLEHLLDVSPVENNQFLGARKPGGVGRVFGGQVIAQALGSAIKTVKSDKLVHSLHAYFMRGGDEDHPIDYEVAADFDGRSFSNRRVVAIQNDKPILNLVASFQRSEGGLAHQVDMPDVPPPEKIEDQRSYILARRDELTSEQLRIMTRPNALEFRAVGSPLFLREKQNPPEHYMWFRTRAKVQGDQSMHRTILAYATDYGLMATSLLPHDRPTMGAGIQTASLDHALWFHEDVAVDDWLLYAMDSPWSGHARGISHGKIFNRDGRLVASCSQEGLIRVNEQ